MTAPDGSTPPYTTSRTATMNGATGLHHSSTKIAVVSLLKRGSVAGSKKIGERKNHGSSAAERIGATSRKYACSTLTASASPSTNANRQTSTNGSASKAGPVPRIAIVIGVSSAISARNVTSWTVTTDAGIVSRGKRALRTSAPWSSSEGAELSTAW